MRLSDYQWSGNPRGLHVASAFQTPMEYDRYTRIGAGWVKLVAAGTEYVDDAMWFLANGITPIVRLYLGRYGAGPYTPQLRALVEAFIRAGVKWFEFYNEPNIDVEWPEGVDPTWEDTGGIIRPLIDNWLEFAEHVASWGAYPGFIALTESNAPRYASIRWGDAFLNYLASTHYDRFARLINSGLWFATHPFLSAGGVTADRPAAGGTARAGAGLALRVSLRSDLAGRRSGADGLRWDGADALRRSQWLDRHGALLE
jgi:hypothetical protein